MDGRFEGNPRIVLGAVQSSKASITTVKNRDEALDTWQAEIIDGEECKPQVPCLEDEEHALKQDHTR